MKQHTDVLIIGGGAVGLCCAHYLNLARRQVTLVEKGEVGSGSSWANAGLVIPGQCLPLAAPGVIAKGLRWMFDPESPFRIKPKLDPALLEWLWKFSRYCTKDHLRRAVPVFRDLQRLSMTLFEELAGAEDIDPGLCCNGIVDAYLDGREFQSGIREARLLRSYGLANRVLDREAFRGLFPDLKTRIVGGIYYFKDAHLVPERFVRGLARHVERNGAVIQRHTEVIGIRRAGRRIVSVQTTRGEVSVEEVVLAGGAWSPGIARDLGLKLLVQPAKGYSVSYGRPPGFPDIPLILVEAKVAVTPMDGVLRLAGTLELAGWDDTIDRRRVKAILKSVPAYLPEVDPNRLDLVEIWRGLRPCTPDGLPYIGRPAGLDNFVVAAGHAMKGISLAPVTGKLVTQVIGGEAPAVDLSALGIERFEERQSR